MKKYIPYIVAALIGFHLRWAVSALNGWGYSMNGMDIAMAITCIIMVWSFKGILPKKKKTAPERQFRKRQNKKYYSGIVPQKARKVKMADIKEQAISKLKNEFNNINKLSRKGKVVSEPILNALTAFCEQSGEFAQAIVQKTDKNLKGCIEYAVTESEDAISDIEAYRRAAAYYFDGAKVSFTMSIDTGSETQNGVPEPVEKKGLNISLDDLL